MTKFNYVYCITELSTNIKYIGSKGCDISPEQHLSFKYFGSLRDDKVFENRQKENPSNYRYEILAVYDNRDDAYKEESRLHYLYDVKNNPEYYNQCNTRPDGINDTSGYMNAYYNGVMEHVRVDDPRFDTGELIPFATGMVSVVCPDNTTMQMSNTDPRFNTTHFSINKGKVTVTNGIETIQLSCDDPKFLSGEYWSIHKGMVTVKDTNGKTSYVPTDHPDYVSGKLKHLSSGMCVVTNGEYNISMPCNDPRIASGEFVHISKGKVLVYNENGDTEQIELTDPRYVSGELKHINDGIIYVKDSHGNISRLHKDDPRIVLENLKPALNGMVMVKDDMNNISCVSINDPNYLSGILKPIASGKVNVKDIHGNRFQTDTNDPRYLSGELFPVNAKLISYYGKVYSMKTLLSILNIPRVHINKMCNDVNITSVFFYS